MELESIRNRALQEVGIHENQKILDVLVPASQFVASDWDKSGALSSVASTFLSNEIEMLYQRADRIGDPSVLANEVRIVRVENTPVLVLIGHTLTKQNKMAREFSRRIRNSIPESALLRAVEAVGQKLEEMLANGTDCPIVLRFSSLETGLSVESVKILFHRLCVGGWPCTFSPIYVDGQEVFDFIICLG